MIYYFKKGSGLIAAKINGKSILFSDSQDNLTNYYSINHLKLSIDGMIKENPDLKGLPPDTIREVSVLRFNKKLASMKGQKEVEEYVIKELKDSGYKLISKQTEGGRIISLKDE